MGLLPISLVMLLAGIPLNPNAPASIRGVVVTSETNIPVVHAIVQLFPEQDEVVASPKLSKKAQQPWSRVTKTDRDGAYVFEKVQPGNYRVSVVTPNSASVQFFSDPASVPGTRISAAAGESVKNVRLELAATASISGRIVDRDGKPIQGIAVAAMTPSYENGHRILGPPGNFRLPNGATTNGRGEYRIDGLAPGQYYVAANGIQKLTTLVNVPTWCWNGRTVLLAGGIPQISGGGYGAVGPISQNTDLTRTFPVSELNRPSAKTFYPGVQSSTGALPIDLHLGAARERVDFRIENTADIGIPELHGTVVDSATGKRVQQASVWITPIDGGGPSCLIDAKNGSFKSVGVPPGKYVVSANLNDGPAPLAGRMILDTGNKENIITIPVTPLPHIRGRIVVEGEAAASDIDLSRLSVNLHPDPEIDSARLTFAPVSRDGTFEIAGVMGWDYRVSLRSPDSNTYIQSIHFGEEDVLRGGLHLETQSTANLEIVIRRNAGAVAGIAPETANRQGRIRNVVLAPDPTRRNRLDLYRTAQINENGEFEMRGLVPGDYRIFAWEHVTDGAWTDPEFMRLYENLGTPVQVLPGETAHATVTAIAPWK